MEYFLIIERTIYFLALINPISKVFVLISLEPPISKRDLLKISFNSSLTAYIILCSFTAAGLILFKNMFHIDIYSLKVDGGIILFIVGLEAVTKDTFYEKNVSKKISNDLDFSVVPLGAPLIAGSGTITGAISISSEIGLLAAFIALTLALTINFLIMLCSSWISKALPKIHTIGPVIRITRLIVTAIAIQMIFNGIKDWAFVVFHKILLP